MDVMGKHENNPQSCIKESPLELILYRE